MPSNELFDDLRQFREPLTERQRLAAIDELAMHAKLGIRYFYTLREACAILHCSYDEMNTLIHLYRLDVVTFRDAYRVPWWALAEYLIDPEDEIEEEIDELIRSRYRQPGFPGNSRSDLSA